MNSKLHEDINESTISKSIKSIGNNIYKYVIFIDDTDTEPSHVTEIFSNNRDDLMYYMLGDTYRIKNVLIFNYTFHQFYYIYRVKEYDGYDEPIDDRINDNKYIIPYWCKEQIRMTPKEYNDGKYYELDQFQVEQYVRYYFS